MAEPVTPAVRDGAVEVVRSEERLTVRTRMQVSGRVRVAKRVVTEERTVTVTVRREELVVEHLPAGEDDAAPARRPGTDGPVVELVLSEEEAQVTTRVVPRERVRVFLDRVTQEVDVSGEVAREVVDVDSDVDTPAP